MNHSIEFGGDPQVLTVTLEGVLDARSLRAVHVEIVSHPDFRAGMLILADISGLETSTMTDEEYEHVRDLIASRDQTHPARAIAFVASDPRTFEGAVHHRAYFGGTKSQREVFRSREDATAWLAQQR